MLRPVLRDTSNIICDFATVETTIPQRKRPNHRGIVRESLCKIIRRHRDVAWIDRSLAIPHHRAAMLDSVRRAIGALTKTTLRKQHPTWRDLRAYSSAAPRRNNVAPREERRNSKKVARGCLAFWLPSGYHRPTDRSAPDYLKIHARKMQHLAQYGNTDCLSFGDSAMITWKSSCGKIHGTSAFAYSFFLLL